MGAQKVISYLIRIFEKHVYINEYKNPCKNGLYLHLYSPQKIEQQIHESAPFLGNICWKNPALPWSVAVVFSLNDSET